MCISQYNYDMDNDSTLYIYTIINCCRGEKVIVTDSPSLWCLLMSSMSSCLLELSIH